MCFLLIIIHLSIYLAFTLKLLGEILLERANFNVMIRYIGDADNLKQIMNLLRDNSKNIQFEAFHVFKVFVVNPNKTNPVLYILEKNKEKIISYLEKFHEDRSGILFYHHLCNTVIHLLSTIFPFYLPLLACKH